MISLVPIPFQNSPIYFLSPQVLMRHTTPVLLSNTECMLKKPGHYQNPIALSLSREDSDTFLSTQFADFSKTCCNIAVCDFHPSYKQTTTDQQFQKLLVNM